MPFLTELFNKKKQPKYRNVQKNIDLSEIVEDYFEEDEDTDDTSTIKEPEEILEIPEEKEVYEVVEREIHPAKIICPDCGGITLEGLEFCDKCGGELL